MAANLATLYVIKEQGRNAFWACSSEHGCGWSDTPKQSFTKSELTREIARLTENGWFRNLEVLSLNFTLA